MSMNQSIWDQPQGGSELKMIDGLQHISEIEIDPDDNHRKENKPINLGSGLVSTQQASAKINNPSAFPATSKLLAYYTP